MNKTFVLNPLLLCILSSYAMADEDGVKQLPTISLSVSRDNRDTSEMTQTVKVLTEEQIQQQISIGKEFKDILAQLIPGMDASSQGRTNYGMNLRGRSIMVIIDGVRLNSSRSDSRQFDSIDPFNIERIEVISGATSLYGGGSTGGIINIITKKGQAKPTLEFSSGIKSGFHNGVDHDENYHAAISGGTDQLFGRLSASYQKFGGAYDGSGNEVLIDNTQTGLQYSDRLDIMGTGTYKIDDHQQLDLTTQYYKSEADDKHGLYLGENFSAVKGTTSAYNSSGLDSDRIPGTERYLASLQYSNKDFFGQDLIAQVFYRDESFSFYPFPTYNSTSKTVTAISASQQDTSFYGAKFSLNSKFSDQLSLAYGIDIDYEKFTSNQKFFNLTQANSSGGLTLKEAYTVGRYPDYNLLNIAPFLQANYDLGAFVFNTGIRYQYTKNKVDDFIGYAQQQAIAKGTATSADAVPGGKTDYSNFLFNAGGLWRLNDANQISVNFSQGFEVPDIAKYYGSGIYSLVNGHYVLTNSVNVNDSKLDGIKVNSYELAWKYNTDQLKTQLSAYYSTSDKSININKTDMTISIADDKRRIYGIDGSLDWYIPQSNLSTGLSFNAIKSEVKSDGEWKKLSVDTASTSKAGAYLNWNQDQWNMRLQGQKVFRLTDDDNKKLEGYFTADFIIGYQLPIGQVSFSIENLFDEKYTTIWGQRSALLYSPAYGSADLYSYQGRGRTYGLNYSFKF